MTGRQFVTGRHLLSAVLVVLLTSIQPVFAQGRDPYKKLFQQPSIEQTARVQQRAQPAAPPPRVVCGMRVIPMDPNIDPKIFAGPKPGDTRYTIRAIEPPVCK